jgi:hypothetical protein
MIRLLLASAGLIGMTIVAGCGDDYTPAKGVIVTGKLLQNGQPVSVAPTPEHYNGPDVIFFAATPGDAQLADANAYPDAAGNFRVEYEGYGIPPGRYKVAVVVRQGGPETDVLLGRLGRETTTIEVEVPKEKLGGTHDMGVLDIAEHLK